MVSADGFSLLLRRAQSVFDFTEVDFCLAERGFAERNDADFMLVLRMNNGDRYASQKPQRDKALLAVGEPIIFKRKRYALEHRWRVDEIEPMLLYVERALPF